MAFLHIVALAALSFLIGYVMWIRNRRTFTKREFVAMQAVTVLIAILGFNMAKYGALQSVEHWNGRITEKLHGTEHCCHCYKVCDARDKDGRCTSEHEVCPHIFDYYWNLKVSTGDTLPIASCESWESNVPAVWANAKVNEPASVPHHYTNYLKAGSLLGHKGHEAYLNQVPEFPEVRDFYKVPKVVNAEGIALSPDWDNQLHELNADLGSEYQVDVTMVFTRQDDPRFADAIESKWLFGPKNAFIIVVGAPDGETIKWAQVVTISKVESLKLQIRDKLPGMKLNDPTSATVFIRSAIIAGFKRTRMAEYEYLAKNASPPTGWLILLYILHAVISFGIAYYCVHNRHREWGDSNDLSPKGGFSGSLGRGRFSVFHSFPGGLSSQGIPNLHRDRP